ncbi:MAG: ABC transporter permease [Ruminococcus sp.]|nr:ABC transporter permease [Ruminococcus sp.]
MKSPLRKRVGREIKGETGKYIVIFLFMTALIAIASGFFVADASLKKSYDESFEKYNIEDGNFEFALKPDEQLIGSIENEGGLKLFENYYSMQESVGDSRIRLFTDRKDVNKVCVLEGRLPDNNKEISLDRLYMKSNDLKKGDSIKVADKKLEIVGIVALPDYSALYENNTDFMFDTEKFGVGIVTQNLFDEFSNTNIHYSYSWKYNEPPKDRTGSEAIGRASELSSMISQKAQLLDFIPGCTNNAINFSGNDIGHDSIMMMVMLYMLIVIIAFVFAVTTSNTIVKEANVIGTLRASGYTKWELIRHYMSAPLIVLLIASIIGNILGYTLFKDYMAKAYLDSYSLVSYETIWSPDAFIDTTIVPLIILALINFIMLARILSLSPLNFLRRDLKRHQRKKAFKLNTKIGIMKRYRLRVVFQNIPGYVTIFAGILFSSVIFLFGMLFNPLLDQLEEDTLNNMIAPHQYILKADAPTDNVLAEKFAVNTLETTGRSFTEDITVYGFIPDSRYFRGEFNDEKIIVSDAYADKYSLKKGDTLTLKDKYTDTEYEFTIGGVYTYPSTLAVFTSLEDFNTRFGNPAESFSGYLCSEEINDIDKKMIATHVTKDDLTKTSRQLKRSMGSLMTVFLALGVGVVILVVFMLSKVIIEKNVQSISMAKILGYKNGEISSIYIHTTTIVTLVSIVACLPLAHLALDKIWRTMMMEYSGWISPNVPVSAYFASIALASASYIVTVFFLKRRINRIPLDEALKNVE